MRNKIRRLLREIGIAGVHNVWLLTTLVTDIVIIVLATVVAAVAIIVWKLSHTKGIQVCDGGCLVASGRSAVY